MANDFSDVTPKLLTRGLMSLRANLVMPMAVVRDTGNEPAMRGSVINVPIPTPRGTRDVVPGASAPTPTDTTINTAPVALSKWQDADFYLTDKNRMEIVENNVFPMQAQEAINALTSSVDQYILEQYKNVYGFAGAAGVTPFASTVAEATAARKQLNIQLAPQQDRFMVIDPEAEAAALGLTAFTDAAFVGDANAIQEGELTRRLGFMWALDQNIPNHTAGVPGGTITVKTATAHAIGTETITVTNTAAGTLLEGDIITFAGDTQTYVVGADVTWSGAGDEYVAIQPPLQIALVGGEAITLTADHIVNLAFQRGAFVFASRPLDTIDKSAYGVQSQYLNDPLTNITLRLEVQAQHKQISYAYDILYGAACVRPALAVRVAG